MMRNDRPKWPFLLLGLLSGIGGYWVVEKTAGLGVFFAIPLFLNCLFLLVTYLVKLFE